MKILWIFFGVITKLDYIKGHFGVFSKDQGIWGYFLGCLKFLIFFFFLGGGGEG